MIEACLELDVKRVIALSTDKAAAPINLYGATKLCSDKLFVSANSMVGKRDLKFGVVRYGNVMGSRGSVFPFFLNRKDEPTLPVTDERMTRFNISLREGVDMVIWALANVDLGEIFVPKIPSYRILDVVKAINPKAKVDLVGVRPGEKLHEEMITFSDSPHTVDFGNYFAIFAPVDKHIVDNYLLKNNAQHVPEGFNYSSGNNDKFLNVDEIRDLIRINIDPDFNPK